MSVVEERIAEGWRTGRLCDGYPDRCLREGPHFPGEYGCIYSGVAVYMPDHCVEAAVAVWTSHRLGFAS